MKITTRYYKECVNKTIKRLTRHKQTLLDILVLNATAYMVEDMLFERGKLDMAYTNEKDFITMSAEATIDLVNLLLEKKDRKVATWTLCVAEFCTDLCEEIFSRKYY